MVFGVDFDGTLCSDAYPNIGKPNLSLIKRLLAYQTNGTKLILWTCRANQFLNEAISWCSLYGLHFDAINENLPEIVAKYGSDSRKITADLYIDDRMISPWDDDAFLKEAI